MFFDLEKYDQWLLWDYEDGTKIPKQTNGRNAKSNDPSTWARYADVIGHEKIAFVISESDPFFGVDLDDSITDGVLTAEASEIVEQFRNKALIEISPSGTGLKITAVGKKPEGSRCVYWSGKQRVEIYDKSRFWTITKQPLYASDSQEIRDCQDELNWLVDRLAGDEWQRKTTQPSCTNFSYSGDSEIERRAKKYLASVPTPRKGTINDTLFSVCGHLHAFRTVDHLGLSPKQVFELVWAWCAGCDPGLTQDYLWERVESSARCGKSRDLKYPEIQYTPITKEDLVAIELGTEKDDEELVEEMVPSSGLIREIYDFYNEISISPSPVMGMATAMAAIETILGQRLQTETGLRTNDLNVVLGPTGCGKEACEKTIAKLFAAADCDSMIMPSGVQSGNGLLNFMSGQSVAIWVKDEFGVYLENVFGKRKNPMEAQVGRYLLELYNKADGRYSGNAHASGTKHAIEQPHLVLLGLSTQGTIFDSLSFRDVENGMMNRLSFWVVTQNPPAKRNIQITSPPERLVSTVRRWVEWVVQDSKGNPDPVIFKMTPEANERWYTHRQAIYDRKDYEETARASMWSRTAARSLKFALCKRASEIIGPEAISEFQRPQIEYSDVEWGIRLSNWLTRSACDLIAANTSDTNKGKAEIAILDFVSKTEGWVNLRTIQRNRKIIKGDLVAAATRLASEKRIAFERSNYGKRERLQVRKLS